MRALNIFPLHGGRESDVLATTLARAFGFGEGGIHISLSGCYDEHPSSAIFSHRFPFVDTGVSMFQNGKSQSYLAYTVNENHNAYVMTFPPF